MTKSRDTLKTFFETGDIPTEQQFVDLIDSLRHLEDGDVVKSITRNREGNLVITLSDNQAYVITQANDEEYVPKSGGRFTGAIEIVNPADETGIYLYENGQMNTLHKTPYGLYKGFSVEGKGDGSGKLQYQFRGIPTENNNNDQLLQIIQYKGGAIKKEVVGMQMFQRNSLLVVGGWLGHKGTGAGYQEGDKLRILEGNAEIDGTLRVKGIETKGTILENGVRVATQSWVNAIVAELAGNAKAKDSDKLDGLDSTSFARQYIIPAKTVKKGWYTVAINPGNRASAMFVLRDTRSSYHQSVHFYAAHHYGTGNVINVLSNSKYANGGTMRYIRIKEKATYDGAMLQVYIDVDGAPVSGWVLENYQVSGWLPRAWVPDGTDPKGIPDFKKLTDIAVQVDLDLTQGIQSSEELFIKGKQAYHQGYKPKNIDPIVDYGRGDHLHGYTDKGVIATSSDKADYRKIPATGVYTYRTYTGNKGAPVGFGAAIGFGKGTAGSVEIIGQWTGKGGNLWTRSLRDCCQNWSEWNKIWTSGNDGKGSGLDADKLDGIDSTGFIRKGVDDNQSWNGQYLIFNFTDADNVDAISFNDKNNSFHFNGNAKKSISTATANIHANEFRIKDSKTRLSRGKNNAFRVTTNHGYVDFGAQNDGHAHLITDRPRFYFNKEVKITGSVIASGNVTAFSDRRLKTALQPVKERFLDKIDQLRPTYYQWKDKAKEQTTQLGFIAQDVMKVFPEWVHKNEEHYAMSYDKMGAVLAVKGIQELHAEIKQLKSELKQLQHAVTS